MKEFSIRVNITEKKCGLSKTRITCHHGRYTSIRIGATIPSQERWGGLDIHGCCALPIQGSTMSIPQLVDDAHYSHAHNALIYHDEYEVYYQLIDSSYIYDLTR